MRELSLTETFLPAGGIIPNPDPSWSDWDGSMRLITNPRDLGQLGFSWDQIAAGLGFVALGVAVVLAGPVPIGLVAIGTAFGVSTTISSFGVITVGVGGAIIGNGVYNGVTGP